MAKDTRHRTTAGNRFRFLLRVLGLTALVTAAVGAVVADAASLPADPWTLPAARAAFQGDLGIPVQVTTIAVAVAVLALVVELVAGLFLVTGRRSLTEATASVQVALAVALGVAVNVYSFTHFARVDLTRDRQFTLPPGVADELKKLRADSPTTIVVLQQHRTFGGADARSDSYDAAAGAKVVEKVNDLVALFREFGPRFNVVALDTSGKRYDAELKAVTANAPELRAAIEASPENSIFFAAAGKVQRLPFGEFLQLDKTASKAADGGRGNLVLLPQGVEGFARKVLAIQARKPRVGIAVVHPALGTTGSRDEQGIGMPGVRTALEANGFEVSEVVLKRWGGAGGLSPAADSTDENKLELTEARAESFGRQVRALRAAAAEGQKEHDRIANATLAQLNAMFRTPDGRLLKDAEKQLLVADIDRQLEEVRAVLDDKAKKLADAEAELAALRGNERAVEARRSTDVRAKLGKALADVDVLIVPRLTYLNMAEQSALNPKFFPLSSEQAAAVREFLRAGKPVLAAFGPSVASPERRPLPPEDVKVNAALPADPVEQVLAQAGILFGDQVILSDAEERAFAEARVGALATPAEAPKLSFDPTVVASGPSPLPPRPAGRPNPVGEAVRVTARGAAAKLDVEARDPRPVYLTPERAAALPFAGVIAQTGPDGWNESAPWEEDDGNPPRYQPAGDKDPKKGTRDEERRGPFPVGVAVEVPVGVLAESVPGLEAAALAGALAPGATLGGLATLALPPDAFAAKADNATVRIAAFGHGGLFTGGTLKPANEKLLLHTVNWLLGRSDRLPRGDVKPWAYPRVTLSEREARVWHWGTFLGLPLLAAYLGLIVLMVRKVR